MKLEIRLFINNILISSLKSVSLVEDLHILYNSPVQEFYA